MRLVLVPDSGSMQSSLSTLSKQCLSCVQSARINKCSLQCERIKRVEKRSVFTSQFHSCPLKQPQSQQDLPEVGDTTLST